MRALRPLLLFLLIPFFTLIHGESLYLELPDWVQPRNGSMFYREVAKDLAAIRKYDVARKRIDVILYGDSITAWSKPWNLTKTMGTRDVWNRYFGDLRAEPFGIPGDRIAHLTWRLAVAGERPKFRDPKVVVIFIGINDVVHKTPDMEARMSYLLTWLNLNMPRSQVVVQLLLPSLRNAEPVNEAYRRVAGMHGVIYSSCGQDIPRNNRTFMADILHPNAVGQEKILSCLRGVVQPMLAGTIMGPY